MSIQRRQFSQRITLIPYFFFIHVPTFCLFNIRILFKITYQLPICRRTGICTWMIITVPYPSIHLNITRKFGIIIIIKILIYRSILFLYSHIQPHFSHDSRFLDIKYKINVISRTIQCIRSCHESERRSGISPSKIFKSLCSFYIAIKKICFTQCSRMPRIS